MKISTLINYAGGFKEAVAEVKELEQAGLDGGWGAEADSFDAPSAMGYLAAQTQRVIIASGRGNPESTFVVAIECLGPTGAWVSTSGYDLCYPAGPRTGTCAANRISCQRGACGCCDV